MTIEIDENYYAGFTDISRRYNLDIIRKYVFTGTKTLNEVEFYTTKSGYKRYKNISKDKYKSFSEDKINSIIEKKTNQIKGLRLYINSYSEYRKKYIYDCLKIANEQEKLINNVRLEVDNKQPRKFLVYVDLIYSFSFPNKSIENNFFNKMEHLNKKIKILEDNLIQFQIPDEIDKKLQQKLKNYFNDYAPKIKNNLTSNERLTYSIETNHNELLGFDDMNPKQNTPETLVLKQKFESIGFPVEFLEPAPDDVFNKIAEKHIETADRLIRTLELIIRSNKKASSKQENLGYVYVMSNKAYPNIYKIGSTYGLPEERAEELTGTGHLHPFKVEFSFQIKDAEYYEKSIHNVLEDHRVNKNREFFDIDIDNLKTKMNLLIERINKSDERLNLSKLKKILNN